MEHKDTQKILDILRISYPNAYRNMSKSDAEKTVILYHFMFKDYPTQLVLEALYAYIGDNEYPPTIAGLKKYITRFVGEHDYEAMWNELWQGICGNVKFKDMCKPNQKYIGSQQVLDDMGSDERTVMDVVKGQYMKRIPEIVENEKFERQVTERVGIEMATEMKAKLNGVVAKMLGDGNE